MADERAGEADPVTVLNDLTAWIEAYRDTQRRGSNAWNAAHRIFSHVERVSLRFEFGDEADPAILAERYSRERRKAEMTDLPHPSYVVRDARGVAVAAYATEGAANEHAGRDAGLKVTSAWRKGDRVEWVNEGQPRDTGTVVGLIDHDPVVRWDFGGEWAPDCQYLVKVES